MTSKPHGIPSSYRVRHELDNMNRTMSIIFRAIPLLMGAVCLSYGLYILAGPDDADHFIAGHVTVGLSAICYALFTTAATIIRQLINRYGRVWEVILPLSGYVAAAAAILWGIVLANRDNTPENLTAGFVVIGVGLVAACVSTVAAASTKFTLIQSAQLLEPLGGPPEGAHTRAVGTALIIVPGAAAAAGFSLATGLLLRGDIPGFVAGHVLIGLSAICTSLISLVASIVRQVRNVFSDGERFAWAWLVGAAGMVNLLLGLFVLFSSNEPYRLAPGCVLIGLGLICFSILSKVLLLALVWRRTFALANRIPLMPIGTALTCLFFAAFLFEAAGTEPAFFVGAHVLVGLGAVCFTLFSIVSILEEGTS
ncbi:DUF2776 family protein [Arthrobacter caoxuetaonis]|uniref:DUF2776 domain-containing protein n=1 Tax=Arthrobacter caoxuetaonis TaxID=2886935 RepID=A0A9X1MD56_9MICC|nr:DUF2776 family protein [Arthrobacter caoxuetaonis]MCC3297788.1 DUF2776 domain-containing protein [Arthrobacter caoxuetaonis]USQ56018.1 DUF2776 domain-containing protein [Arthrobacter caoxuetaonis]